MVCGPTASGKSGVSDFISGRESVKNILVDSMQVYGELPEISNQRRSREVTLRGVASVTEGWSVAKHREAALKEIEAPGENKRFVLDAGTGMYLNAILFDFPLAPKVSKDLRSRAERESTEVSGNPRRATRALELSLAGADERGSIWGGNLRFDTYVIYLRPDRVALDGRIEARSREIVENGLEEARDLADRISAKEEIHAPVMDAIGVREMLLYASGDISKDEAEARISARTRKLARRQMTWFDKLLASLKDRAKTTTVDNSRDGELLPPEETYVMHSIHDIIGLWKD